MSVEPPQTHFICYSCAVLPEDGSPPKGHYVFAATPTGVDAADGVALADCPSCGRSCRELPIERSRRLAQVEGRLATLDPEARKRTEKAIVAAVWKTGRYSKAAIGPPCSGPDIKRCQGCEYLEPGEEWKQSLCIAADKCLRDENLWLRVLHAYAQDNPAALRDVFAEGNAHAVALFMRLVRSVETGSLTVDQPVPGSEDSKRTEINPLIPEIVKMIKVLGVDPASWRMTTQAAGVGAKDDAEADAAKVQGARDALDLLRDPKASLEYKKKLAEAAHILMGSPRGEEGDDGPDGQ